MVHLDLDALAFFHDWFNISLIIYCYVATSNEAFESTHCIVSQKILLLKLLNGMLHFRKFSKLLLNLLLV